VRLDERCKDLSTPAAELTSADGRVRLQLATNQPALQIYSGQGLASTPARDGGVYAPYAGIALEPQFAPDSPNHLPHRPDWPDCVLRPGQRYLWRSQLRFVVR
jgi:aldose 1-epimerase